MATYIEYSLIEKLHARITEVSPANPGETLNDAVERLIAERNIAREIAEGLRLVLLEESNGLVMAQLQREAAIAERDALREEVELGTERLRTAADALREVLNERDAIIVDYQDRLAAAFTDIGALAMDCKTLRAALVSLVDGKGEFDIEYDTGIPADEARRIIDLAYNRQ